MLEVEHAKAATNNKIENSEFINIAKRQSQ